LGAIAYTQLTENVVYVTLHGGVADTVVCSDLFVAFASHNVRVLQVLYSLTAKPPFRLDISSGPQVTASISDKRV
jgi:hypothetical protein